MASLIKAGLTIDETIVYIFKNLKVRFQDYLGYITLKSLKALHGKKHLTNIGKMSYCTEFYQFH